MAETSAPTYSAQRPPGPSAGPLSPPQILRLLVPGQLVTCTVEERPKSPLLQRLAMYASAPEDTITSVAACVVDVDLGTEEVVLLAKALTDRVGAGQPLVADFTDAAGTYTLSGTVSPIHLDGMACLVLAVQRASEVQMRRHARVPVMILPQRAEIQYAAGAWRPVLVEIVDLASGGLGLRSAELLRAGSQLHIEFELPGQQAKLAVTGRVAAAAAAAAGQPRRYGVAFE